MARINIPRSIEEAVTSLNGLGALLKAKEWQRAAIVYAFTRDGSRGGDTTIRNNANGLTPHAFAKLGITGLTSDNTVREYRKAWAEAIKDGLATAVGPGDTATVPDLDWPPGYIDHNRGSHATGEEVVTIARRNIVDDPAQALADLIKDHDEVAPAIATGVIANPAIRSAVEALLVGPAETRTTRTHTERITDYDADLMRGINLLLPVFRAIQSGAYAPGGTQQLLLHFFAELVEQSSGHNDATPQDTLFDQIDTFLRGTTTPE